MDDVVRANPPEAVPAAEDVPYTFNVSGEYIVAGGLDAVDAHPGGGIGGKDAEAEFLEYRKVSLPPCFLEIGEAGADFFSAVLVMPEEVVYVH